MSKFGPGGYREFTQKMPYLVLNIKLTMSAEGLIVDIGTSFLFASDWFTNKRKIAKGFNEECLHLQSGFSVSCRSIRDNI